MSEPLRVGVLGLGRMGRPIARRLSTEFAVTTFDPAHGGGSAAEVAATSDVLVTVLPGPPEARSALPALFPVMPAGSLWLDLTSNDPRVVDELVDAATGSGVRSAAAPMAGGPADAESGELRFFVAAALEDRFTVGRILEPLGRPFEPDAGERPSDAHLVKLLANGLWFGQVVAVTEALLAGKKHGLDPELLRTLLAGSAAGSVFLDRDAPLLLAGDDMPEFGIDRVVEELDGLQAIAEQSGAPHSILSVVADLNRQALAEFGPVGGELLAARLLERRAGGELSAPS
ncbi:MAG TPA: NAD(P)-binding domain-containing protein [Pseudolysinimonas sp.]|nr:NAD(P)-binding domain-containing protein [Pseudolysinimonas sp.]